MFFAIMIDDYFQRLILPIGHFDDLAEIFVEIFAHFSWFW